jgi:hypothetical protein
MTSGTFANEPRSTVLRAVALLLAVASLVVVCSPPEVARATTVAPAFPRLAIWWPDSDHQPVADRARVDWIALQNYDADHIAELRAANPSIIILGSTSARELNYSLNDYDDPQNVELRNASTDWILTQVGSTLTADITTSTTSIPVADVSKFAVGEMVLVDHELMHVSAIGGSSLTVTARGPVEPPASHGSGTRIASVVSHWPNSVTMDLSGGCPERDVGYGPETWNEWNVRRGAAVLRSADWDGLLIDTLESDIGWMVTVGDVRSIDPLRTNTPVTDGYKAFNTAWSAGALAYGDGLRAAVGMKTLVTSGNMKNYELNGAVFERFPYPTLPLSWWDYAFVGPYPDDRPWVASYPEWSSNAALPNLTLIQTYGARTDYKLMRYGLTSALLYDGYFSYALSSSGHAVNGVWWYDEYDDAGVGRGYLGQPIAAAVKAGGAWRRDFANGVSLVNPTTAPVTVNLGRAFRKIKGKQDPAVNSGATVSSVTIPAHDGIILLRIPTVSFSASAKTLAFGAATTLTVTAAVASTTIVRLERRTAGTSTWRTSATLSLDVSGGASVVRTPGVSTEYRAVLVSNGVVSSTVKIGVRPLLTIHASKAAVARRGKVTFSGSITHPGRVPLLLQRRVGRAWRTVRRLTTSTSGRYRTVVSFASRGTFTYRVYAPADVSHLATASGALSIRVR